MSDDPASWTTRPGTVFVASVPPALGPITSMKVEGDRIICETESGIPFVLNGDPQKVSTARCASAPTSTRTD